MNSIEILQGSNSPLVLPINSDGSTVYNIRVVLYSKNGIVKFWRDDEAVVTDNIVTCPLTSQETADFPVEKLEAYVKWSDSSGTICFARPLPVYVRERKDKYVV